MKMFNMGLVAAIGALALLATGCDSDDGDTTPITDTADAQVEVEDDTVEDDTTEGDTTEGDTTDDTVEPAGACTNAADLATIQATDPAGPAGTCGQGCYFGAADPDDLDAIRACTITCITAEDQQNIAISDACAGCYGDSVICAVQNCVAQCAADPSAAACVQCREDNGCTPNFFTCSGLPQN